MEKSERLTKIDRIVRDTGLNIVDFLNQHGSVNAAAAALKVAPNTLRRHLRRNSILPRTKRIQWEKVQS